MEVWKPCNNYEKYIEVSNKGRVRNYDRYIDNNGGKTFLKSIIYKSHLGTSGYEQVHVSLGNAKSTTLAVHRLVAETFIPNEDCKDLTVNHKDGNKENNNINNLEWLTQKENIRHAIDTGLITYTKLNKKKCLNCNKNYQPEKSSRKFCSTNCHDLYRIPETKPTKKELIKDLTNMSMVKIGKKYNVSDNTVRKWCKNYNLPYMYKDIQELIKNST